MTKTDSEVIAMENQKRVDAFVRQLPDDMQQKL